MQIIDILEHGKCSVITVSSQISELQQTFSNLKLFFNFVNLPKREIWPKEVLTLGKI